jgi:16S rRNA (cytosine1402-N4)-methyltransferase
MGAHVTAIDRDPAAIATARNRLAAEEAAGRFRVILGNFAEADRLLPDPTQKFDGILADLGVSSHQFDDETRGFSFREGANLDMRMGEGEGETAAAILNDAEEEELARIFKDYGDEPRARKLAREVVRRRQNREFKTSDDLVGAIRGVLGPRSNAGDFARIFQAMRIAVNDEILSLERALPVLRDKLNPGGVLAVISYHSGEDRIVKHAMRDWSSDCVCPPRQPSCTCRGRALGKAITRKSITASAEEVSRNPRARSARLRAWRSEG